MHHACKKKVYNMCILYQYACYTHLHVYYVINTQCYTTEYNFLFAWCASIVNGNLDCAMNESTASNTVNNLMAHLGVTAMCLDSTCIHGSQSIISMRGRVSYSLYYSVRPVCGVHDLSIGSRILSLLIARVYRPFGAGETACNSCTSCIVGDTLCMTL